MTNITMPREALKLALELKNSASAYWTEKEILIIEKLIDSLAQTEQEPTDTLLNALDYAIVHGWPAESLMRLTAIRGADKLRHSQSLAQPEQEPVMFGLQAANGRYGNYAYSCKRLAEAAALENPAKIGYKVIGYYTTPPKAEQEPVAYTNGIDVILAKHWTADYPPEGWNPLGYTTPSQLTWVGLTDEDIGKWIDEEHDVIRWAEAKLKEKNS